MARPSKFPPNFRARAIEAYRSSPDRTIAESVIGLFKTELIRRRGPWRSLDDLEITTVEWVDWYNSRRLHSALGHKPPAEAESHYYSTTTPPETAQMGQPTLH